MSFSKLTVQKFLATSEKAFITYKAYELTLHLHAHKFLLNHFNRLHHKRFFVVCRRHAKHLDPRGYIALLMTGGNAVSH